MKLILIFTPQETAQSRRLLKCFLKIALNNSTWQVCQITISDYLFSLTNVTNSIRWGSSCKLLLLLFNTLGQCWVSLCQRKSLWSEIDADYFSQLVINEGQKWGSPKQTQSVCEVKQERGKKRQLGTTNNLQTRQENLRLQLKHHPDCEFI